MCLRLLYERKVWAEKKELVEFTLKRPRQTSGSNSPSPKEREGLDQQEAVAGPSLAPRHRGTKRYLISSEKMEHQPLPKKRTLGLSNCIPS